MATESGSPTAPAAGLQHWVQAYCASVGPSAAMCLELVEELQKPGFLSRAGREQLLDLLATLQSLAPDPITVTCAMMLAAEESGADVSKIRSRIAPATAEQLEELHKLKRYASGQDLSATER